ncbi:PTPN14 [Cordylochernes scorpioides]|uniref:protein-tyrosine-phosphatase n=1 Tax=Cordylochernes scorpioides TaxID=51811 RepID=A0ABY6LTS8_9ARAC|nr:PTPN14 [Cordylochernes scorpioides]
MPFKLKLSKKKQYNVLSKSAFVTSVELLDSTQIECTLSTSSLGKECLQNACQRLSLEHLQYLGLQFRSKYNTAMWWVDLDSPLKKQLDKLADHPGLYLRVMYSAMDDEGLQDEATRYHFFLQLKTDIIEGKLPCTLDQAVTLAAYALQAEFGNHDPERHTSEYLSNFVLLPNYLAPEMKEALWEKLIEKHSSLKGISQSLAEVSYIKEAQKLEGYGQECFPAKDSLNSLVILKIFANGICVEYKSHKPTMCLLWSSITNMAQHKKHFVINCKDTARQLDFVLEDATYAKYVYRIAYQHLTLFRNRNVPTIALMAPAVSVGQQQLANGTAHLPTSTFTEVPTSAQKLELKANMKSTSSLATLSASREDIMQPSPPAYRPAPDYNTAVKNIMPKLTAEQDASVQDGVPIDPRIQYLETKVKEGQVFQEFEMVVRTKALADFTTALMPENIMRNRFKDVLPYEENRVKLTPTKENPYGYINASHIRISRLSYIAAQGPLCNTVTDFWQMVWEYDVTIIVMLTSLQEQGQEKCYPYWPVDGHLELRFGPYTIKRISNLITGPFSTSHLMLTFREQQKPLWHFQFHEWPDHCCPDDVSGFLSFMQEIDSVRRITMVDHGQMLVHCSAGVGRSGVVILCDIMFYALNHNEPIDIPGILTQLRMQRMFTVQTLSQYQFVYVVLIQYLKKCRLI